MCLKIVQSSDLLLGNKSIIYRFNLQSYYVLTFSCKKLGLNYSDDLNIAVS